VDPIELRLSNGTVVRLERRAGALRLALSRRELTLELPEAWMLAEALDRLASAKDEP
jgi:hypothetical protein